MKMKNNNNKHVIKQYLNEVSAKVKCPKSVKAVFISELKNDILEYLSGKEGDSLCLEELCDEFGAPEKIADGFLDRDDYKELLKKAKKRSLYLSFAVIALIVLCIVITYLLIYIIQDSAITVNVTNSYNT